MILINSSSNLSFKHAFFIAAILVALPSQLLAEKYTRADLIAYMVNETNLTEAYVAKHIKSAVFDADLIVKMNTPYESRPYADYRPLFVNERLKKRSLAYIEKHQGIFDAAHEKYGVAPEIIASILGIETRFGQNWGRDKVLDALFTLSTGYERRAKFFRNELKEFLLLCEEEGLNPQDVDGSYAGAFGVTQFIPSSFRAYAVDANADGKRDVWHTPQDIIFSVANYFKRHKWTDDKRVANWVNDLPDNAFIKQALKDETRKYRKMSEFEQAGIKKPKGWSSDEKVALIERKTKDGVRQLLVNRNFHAITRWNRSWNYALAVTELAYSLGNKKCDVAGQ